ncbi:MAG: ABC transporter ATP-binding protein [Planctomycetes bacterium]|nr:ABC transporter ATP-binding protein [Planctomycetota bacterium]
MSAAAVSAQLRVRELSVEYRGRRPWWGQRDADVRAVRSVSFDVCAGEALALVGESGCGKSSVARALAGLVRPSQGAIEVHVEELGRSIDLASAGASVRRAAQRCIGIVFQDPYSSLSPRRTVFQTLSEFGRVVRRASRSELELEVAALLDRVGLERRTASAFPHELSGGQRQRVALARALSARPRALVCDEVLSALDPLIQVEMLALLRELVERERLALVFVTHDLGAAQALCRRMAVMYAGELVEIGPSSAVARAPLHPYTRALFAARPGLAPNSPAPLALAGEPPRAGQLPPGCAFHPRCSAAVSECSTRAPALVDFGSGRSAACLLVTPGSEASSARAGAS